MLLLFPLSLFALPHPQLRSYSQLRVDSGECRLLYQVVKRLTFKSGSAAWELLTCLFVIMELAASYSPSPGLFCFMSLHHTSNLPGTWSAKPLSLDCGKPESQKRELCSTPISPFHLLFHRGNTVTCLHIACVSLGTWELIPDDYDLLGPLCLSDYCCFLLLCT